VAGRQGARARRAAGLLGRRGLSSLLGKELIVVTGKGGVGKSTVAAALGLVAARRGLRTIIAEVAARDDVTRALGAEGDRPFVERELGSGLHHISIEPERAMEEYLADQLPVRALAGALASSRLFTYLTAATPGLRELLTIGKVWELAQPDRRTPGARPYDLVILDAPATGHGVAILSAPRTFAEAARVGPIARQGSKIHRMLADPARTGVVAVTAPEEMPVNETLALQGALRAQMGLGIGLLVVNGLLPDRFSDAEAEQLRAAPASAAARTALSGHARARAQREQADRVRGALSAPAADLPFVFAPALGSEALDALSRDLEPAL
jgi:anion-transporting  ArsA/GET3 family ATPase